MKRNKISLKRFSYETDIEPVDHDITRKLMEEFNLIANSWRYHIDGTRYHLVPEYPAILFDLYGYITLTSPTENRNIKITKNINAFMGISNLPEYRMYRHTPKCLQDCYFSIKIDTEKKAATETAKFQSIMLNAINKG